MTKEELIALSDLNREDNIKYISSEAQGIAIALDSDRYAPTLCKLERAYICGRRKSEEQIKEIENYFVESAGYGRDKVRNFMDIVNKALEQKGERITELEKENIYYKDIIETNTAEWEEQGQRVVALEKENAELKEKLKPENCLKLLAKEGYVKFTCENGNEHDQLIKAKDLLLRFIELKNKPCAIGHSINMLLYENICADADQFLNSEVEK